MEKLVLNWVEYSNFAEFAKYQQRVFENATAEDTNLKITQIKVNYAVQKLTAKYKFFAEILYMLSIVYTRAIPTAATDGSRIFINPDFFGPMTEQEVLFVLCHEVMHIALLHTSRQGGRDHDRWNVAGDYEINLLLVEDGILSLEDVVNKLQGLINKDYKGMNAEQLYNDPNMIMPETPQPKDVSGPPKPGQGQGKPGQPGQGQGQGQEGEEGDEEGQPGQGQGSGSGKPGEKKSGEGAGGGKEGEEKPVTVIRGPKTGQVITKAEGDAIAKGEGITDVPKERDEGDIKDIVRKAAQTHLDPRNKSMGRGKGNIYQRIMELTEPIVNWRQELSKFIGKLMLSSDFKMPNRRYVASGQYRYSLQDRDNALERAAVALDVSGSVAASFPEFAAEVVGIAKAKKIKEIAVLPFANDVHDEFIVKGFKKPTPDDFAKVRTGGGTEAIPDVIRWIDTKMKGNPDFVVIVTDGYLTGGLPPAPRKWGKKTIWLVYDNPRFEVPPDWGRIIHANGDPGYWKGV